MKAQKRATGTNHAARVLTAALSQNKFPSMRDEAARLIHVHFDAHSEETQADQARSFGVGLSVWQRLCKLAGCTS